MKFAIIGNGFIAPKHIESIKHIGGEVAAICDIDPSRQWNGPLYTDYHEAMSDVDWVSVCTPNDTHTDIVLAAARKGKKIICEKPITFKTEELELMKGVPNIFGMFQLRHLPCMPEIRRASTSARDVSLVVEMKRSGKYHETWKGDTERSGGLLVNIGCHYFDIIGNLFGYTDFVSKVIKRDELHSEGVLQYHNLAVRWKIRLTDTQDNYERSIVLDDKKFDLVQEDNLHKRVYEQAMWGQGTNVKDEGVVIKMINQI